MTGADKYNHSNAYLNVHPELGWEGALWLIDRDVMVIGIDAYGLDRPFKNMGEDFKRGDKMVLFSAH